MPTDRARFNNNALIVGAGAHVPYGFPTGNEILERLKDIYKHFESPSANHFETSFDKFLEEEAIFNKFADIFFSNLDTMRFGQESYKSNAYNCLKDRIKKFALEVSSSQVSSIDSYLAQNNESAEIGKFLIGFIVSYYQTKEDPVLLKHNWIQHIIQNYIQNEYYKDAFRENPPQIITFNYDTLLEEYILKHLKSYWKMSHDDSIGYIKDLDILHVYGEIDLLSNDQSNAVLESIDGINIIDRGDSGEAIKSRIKEKIQDCKDIYFLGFGFDNDNCSLISDGLNSQTDIHATNIGLDASDYYRIKESFESDINIIRSRDIDCLRLIQDIKPFGPVFDDGV